MSRHRWMIATFDKPQELLSWAVVGGGRKTGRQVAWFQVNPRELSISVDPTEFLKERLLNEGLEEAVGLLISLNLQRYSDLEKRHDGQMNSAFTQLWETPVPHRP